MRFNDFFINKIYRFYRNFNINFKTITNKKYIFNPLFFGRQRYEFSFKKRKLINSFFWQAQYCCKIHLKTPFIHEILPFFILLNLGINYFKRIKNAFTQDWELESLAIISTKKLFELANYD